MYLCTSVTTARCALLHNVCAARVVARAILAFTLACARPLQVQGKSRVLVFESRSHLPSQLATGSKSAESDFELGKATWDEKDTK